MKKCYFIGTSAVYDSDLSNYLKKKCEEIIEKEEQIEFWFFHLNGQFFDLCLSLVTLLKSQHPGKYIKIVRVHDPMRADSTDWSDFVYDTAFPLSLSDKNIYAPPTTTDPFLISTRFIQQQNKVERWILRQMDVVFAYYYPNLEDSVIAQIEYAQKFTKAEVIHIKFEKTEKRIQELSDSMFDERTQQILSMLKANVPKSEISKVIGITGSRIGQISHKAAREIRRELQKNGKKSKSEEMRCGLFHLSREANAFQLIVFESLLVYLVKSYRVSEFWIDKESCNTLYGAILASFCAIRATKAVSAKVVVNIPKNDLVAFGKAMDSYVPPYQNIVNLEIDTLDQSSFCKTMVSQCNCIITDFSSSDSRIFRELSANSECKYLFDLPKKRYQTDEQYEQ